ncbi:MAG: site-specific integrase [Clostridia bacterium]|nr:site-specific integrase [Clostridia bacterium]
MKNRFLSEEIIQKFNTHLLEEERSEKTIEKYNRDISALRRFAEEREISKELVIAYKQHLIESGYAERSVNSMLAAVNSLFQFLEWYDCRVKAIKLSPEIYRPDEKELTRNEYERLVNTAMKQGKEKLAVILQTICGTGIRISELQFITVEAVKRGEAKVHCKGKTRKVFIVSELKTLLLDFIKKNHIKSGPIFLSKTGKPMNRTISPPGPRARS